MNTIFKILLISLALNFATGLTNTIFHLNAVAINDPSADLGTNPQYLGTADDPYGEKFVAGMNSTINPVPDQSNTFFRLIDSLNIGILSKMLNIINNYLYGFTNFIGRIFHLDTAIMFFINGLLSICYIIGAFWLWTGKDLTQSRG